MSVRERRGRGVLRTMRVGDGVTICYGDAEVVIGHVYVSDVGRGGARVHFDFQRELKIVPGIKGEPPAHSTRSKRLNDDQTTND